MESIVLQPLLQVIFEKLTRTLVIENISSLTNFKRDAKRLQDQLLLIQGVIRDAEERQGHEGIRLWLNRLQSVSYDADDFLDELHTKAAQTNKKVSFLSFFNRILVPLLDSSELKEIQKAIADLASDISLFAFRNDVRYRRYDTFERPQTGICVNESQVIGRGEDVAEIIKMLLLPSVGSSTNSPESTHISVLPIVGMGGIGKSTVAQLVYNNSGLENKFHIKIWIDVGQNFNVRKVIRDILEYTAKGGYNSSQLPQLGILQSRLQESIRNQKYLLVLDDVWNEDEAEWSKLREPLSCGIGGSKIVVTTRSQAVAKLMGTYSSSYALKRLSDETCVDLFRQYAFPNGGEEVYPFLTRIGKDIVQKCGGIPLAAKLLGSMLCSQRDEREWSNVLTSRSWDFPTSSIMPALIVSYSQLGPHQKQCFSYCSVFPKNYEINREKLIHQWIAEGLIPSPDDEVSHKKEDTANDYFNGLVSASLFEGASISEEGKIAEFKLHNLIHDLAHYVSKPVQPLQEESDIEELFIWSAERRATVICRALSAATCKRLSIKRLRTLQLFSQGNDFTPYIPCLFKSMRHLRVLNLSNCGITILHKSVGGLIYLRYLDLSNNLMRILPPTLCQLFSLQTLNLSYCHDLEELPETFSNLINLRHLNIEGCTRLVRMPPNIGNLRKLQTLPIFIVGPAHEESLFQLVHLDLHGELKIKHLENVRTNLPNFCIEYKQLHSLSLSWGIDNEGKMGHNARREAAEMRDDHYAENLLCCLPPNRNLKVLQINEYLGTVFPEWMNMFMLPNLKKLVLVNCQRCETLPTLGQLHFLEILTMHGMGEVVEISSEFYGREGKFPCLKLLSLKDFPKLRSWECVESADAFPRLQKLTIVNCPRLINMPRFPCLQHLDMQKCNVDLILWSVTKLNSLSTLTINDFPELTFIPRALLQNNELLTSLTIGSCPKLRMLPATLGLLTSLQSLTIRWCEELENFPREMNNLTSLETLEIIECPGLDSLPDESIRGLKSLKSLSIENCSNLSSLPVTLRNLTALEHLTVMYCPNLLYLPDVMQELQSLRSLNIVWCTELAYLPSELEHAASLHNLEIRGCPKLQELPDWIGNLASLRSLAISECENIKLLPEGLRHLQALQHLSIIDCPDLEMRCRMGTGEDWSKICHIPYKYVGSSTSRQGEASASSSSAPIP